MNFGDDMSYSIPSDFRTCSLFVCLFKKTIKYIERRIDLEGRERKRERERKRMRERENERELRKLCTRESKLIHPSHAGNILLPHSVRLLIYIIYIICISPLQKLTFDASFVSA